MVLFAGHDGSGRVLLCKHDEEDESSMSITVGSVHPAGAISSTTWTEEQVLGSGERRLTISIGIDMGDRQCGTQEQKTRASMTHEHHTRR